jgi:hypothetical protein
LPTPEPGRSCRHPSPAEVADTQARPKLPTPKPGRSCRDRNRDARELRGVYGGTSGITPGARRLLARNLAQGLRPGRGESGSAGRPSHPACRPPTVPNGRDLGERWPGRLRRCSGPITTVCAGCRSGRPSESGSPRQLQAATGPWPSGTVSPALGGGGGVPSPKGWPPRRSRSCGVSQLVRSGPAGTMPVGLISL